jgi:hypothetical protein
VLDLRCFCFKHGVVILLYLVSLTNEPVAHRYDMASSLFRIDIIKRQFLRTSRLLLLHGSQEKRSQEGKTQEEEVNLVRAPAQSPNHTGSSDP